jgi:hypothetical protein
MRVAKSGEASLPSIGADATKRKIVYFYEPEDTFRK